MNRFLIALLAATALPAAARAAESCFAQAAATRSGALGLPLHAQPTPDGRSVLFLRSGPRDTRLHLYRFDVATRALSELARPDSSPETLSVAEKARRERARMSLTGITDFALSDDGRTLLATEADRLLTVALDSSAVTPVPGRGWIAPALSPDGRFVAAVRDNDLHALTLNGGHDHRLTSGGSDTLSHGVAEFAAAEELDRPEGLWWSPDSRTLLYEVADLAPVERHWIADPANPATPPVAFRYPRAGTANAVLSLMLVSRDGGPARKVGWDSNAFPYLVRVVWQAGRPLSLVVMNRAQTEQRVLAVDPSTGQSRVLLSETDPAWIDIAPVGPGTRAGDGQLKLPYWLPDGSGFLWATEQADRWVLQRRRPDGALDRTFLTTGPKFLSLADVAGRQATIVVAPDRIDSAIERLSLDTGAVDPLSVSLGLHQARFATGDGARLGAHRFVDGSDGADGRALSTVRAADGTPLATLPSVAEPLPAPVRIDFTTAGAQAMDALVIRPRNFDAHRHYPVVLSVYAGPGVKLVEHAPRRFIEDQCLADQGYVVVSLDGRGTPGRDHDWERATKGDLIDLPLADQVAGLQALGQRLAEMDMDRVGVTGWSFGGYFTAMATIRRPDIFKVGVAGAPVVDFADYDTAYTERYLGLPQADIDGYRKSNVLTYAAGLSRPLLLMHGLTDDNVYFENSVKLTQALLVAGKPYDLLLLPGTHQLPDPSVRTRVDEARAAFLKNALHPIP